MHQIYPILKYVQSHHKELKHAEECPALIIAFKSKNISHLEKSIAKCEDQNIRR